MLKGAQYSCGLFRAERSHKIYLRRVTIFYIHIHEKNCYLVKTTYLSNKGFLNSKLWCWSHGTDDKDDVLLIITITIKLENTIFIALFCKWINIPLNSLTMHLIDEENDISKLFFVSSGLLLLCLSSHF